MLHRLKPGSLDQHGNVIDINRRPLAWGPCFIPDDISPARKGMLGHFGWCVTPASHWPSIPPRAGMMCIHRGELS